MRVCGSVRACVRACAGLYASDPRVTAIAIGSISVKVEVKGEIDRSHLSHAPIQAFGENPIRRITKKTQRHEGKAICACQYIGLYSLCISVLMRVCGMRAQRPCAYLSIHEV